MIIFAPTSRGVEPRTLITVASANGLSHSSVRKASDQISSLAIFTFPRFSPFRVFHLSAFFTFPRFSPFRVFHLSAFFTFPRFSPFRVFHLSARLRCRRAIILDRNHADYTVELF